MLPAICPSLVDKEKIIRDQANKTLNVYLERVRKYAATLPDSALPPADYSSAPTTRISTPQPGVGSQMLGWAVSSFTNKLTSATGEIQANSNGVRSTPSERPSSTPTANGPFSRPSPRSLSSVPKVTTGLHTSIIPPEVEDEDFGDVWGDIDDNPADAWADDLQQSFQAPSHSTKTSTSTVAFDDGGEPDFEGWLNAQAAAKSQSKKPLPKGLAKKSTSATTGPKSAAPARTSNVMKPASTSATSSKSKATENKSAAEEDDDDWGDAWG